VADDEIATTGPLISFVSGATSSLGHGVAQGLGQWLIISLVVLHIAAITYYLVRRRRNLVCIR
jgi:cytochrome b